MVRIVVLAVPVDIVVRHDIGVEMLLMKSVFLVKLRKRKPRKVRKMIMAQVLVLPQPLKHIMNKKIENATRLRESVTVLD